MTNILQYIQTLKSGIYPDLESGNMDYINSDSELQDIIFNWIIAGGKQGGKI